MAPVFYAEPNHDTEVGQSGCISSTTNLETHVAFMTSFDHINVPYY